MNCVWDLAILRIIVQLNELVKSNFRGKNLLQTLFTSLSSRWFTSMRCREAKLPDSAFFLWKSVLEVFWNQTHLEFYYPLRIHWLADIFSVTIRYSMIFGIYRFYSSERCIIIEVTNIRLFLIRFWRKDEFHKLLNYVTQNLGFGVVDY